MKKVSVPTFTVVLLHGLMRDINELSSIAVRVKNAFGDIVHIIQPTCRMGIKSAIQSITSQGEQVFKELRNELGNQLSSMPLIIIGYSQGGVVACSLAENYDKELNISGVVTIAAPLRGVPLLERGPSYIRHSFLRAAQEGLQRVQYPISRLNKWKMILRGTVLKFILPVTMPGIKDIYPRSSCIEKIHTFLCTNPNNIQFLLIGGSYEDFGDIYNVKNPENKVPIENLNRAFSELVTGHNTGNLSLHDTLIPTASQIGLGVIFDQFPFITNATYAKIKDPIKIKMPGQDRITICIYRKVTHAANLIAIDFGLFMPKNTEQVLHANRIIKNVVAFIKEILKLL